MRYADRPMLQVSAAKYGESNGGRWIAMADPFVSDDGRLMYHVDLSAFGIDGMVHIVLSDMPNWRRKMPKITKDTENAQKA